MVRFTVQQLYKKHFTKGSNGDNFRKITSMRMSSFDWFVKDGYYFVIFELYIQNK